MRPRPLLVEHRAPLARPVVVLPVTVVVVPTPFTVVVVTTPALLFPTTKRRRGRGCARPRPRFLRSVLLLLVMIVVMYQEQLVQHVCDQTQAVTQLFASTRVLLTWIEEPTYVVVEIEVVKALVVVFPVFFHAVMMMVVRTVVMRFHVDGATDER